MLVEDDSNTAKSIELMLASEGFVCDTTDLGEDGLEIGRLYDYDIILLDLMLPDIDGYEVLRRLRAARITTPVLILSGLSQSDDKIKGGPIFGTVTSTRIGPRKGLRFSLDLRLMPPKIQTPTSDPMDDSQIIFTKVNDFFTQVHTR